MKRMLTITLVAALALFAGSAYANFCARDVVPATTLLVPYAIVTMDGDGEGAQPDPTGYTTYLSVTNTSWEATIIHVVVWNAVSEHIIDFDQVLSGYDVWEINFADLLNGNWSNFQTFTKGYDANKNYWPFEWGPDGRSAYQGIAGDWDGVPSPYPTGLYKAQATNGLTATRLAGCTWAELDNDAGADYKGFVVSGLQDPLWARDHGGCPYTSGGTDYDPSVRQHPGGADWLAGLTANPLFFYVTVDNYINCDLIFPGDTGYFQNVNYENVLIGEIYYINAASGYSEATPAVHIESDLDSILYTQGRAEFYRSDIIDEATLLEPLATAFGFRYFNQPPALTSSVILWKNATEFDANDDVLDCGSYLYYAWDMDEHVKTRASQCPVSPCGSDEIDPNEFPFETQEVWVNNNNFDLPGDKGWMLIVLPPSYDLQVVSANFDDPTPDTALLDFLYQGWVGTRIAYVGFSAGLEAATMANSHCFENQVLPALGINFNYADGNHVPAWW